MCTSSLLPTTLSMCFLLGYLNFANLLTVKWLSHHLSFFGYYRCLASFLSSLVMQVPVSVSYLFIPSFQFSTWLCFCQRNIQDSNLSWFWRLWTPSCLWLVFLHCLVLVLFFFFIPLLILSVLIIRPLQVLISVWQGNCSHLLLNFPSYSWSFAFP